MKTGIMRKTALVVLMILLWSNHSFAQQFKRTDLGVKTNIQSMDIEVQFYSPEIVRVLKSPEGSGFKKESLSVIKQPEQTALDITTECNVLVMKSKALCVMLNLSTGSVSFNGLDSRPLITEKEYTTQFDPVMDVTNKTYKVSQAFLLDKQEAIYGLGQQQEGKMNQRNQVITLRQENTKICIPFIHSVKGYGLFWDNYSETTFKDDITGMSFGSEVGDCSDYYFMYGSNMDGVIGCMRDLTGQAPLFPLWAWGYWQSRERYTSQSEIVDVVQKYRDLKVPLDGIVQDWQYWSTDNAYWNAIAFGNPLFSKPKKMIDDIHRLNAHAIISVWPSFGPKTKPYQEFRTKNMLFNFETFPTSDSARVYDVYNPEARSIYWRYMNDNIFSLGMDGWWLDATEPEHVNAREQDMDTQTALGSFRKVRNAYPLMNSMGVYEHQRAVNQNKRVYILTRSAFAGQQRYGSNSWSGDIDGSWDVFHKQISAGLNFSLCGIPYWNTDIGGFWVRNGNSGYADYRELYVRWLQFGTFCPMMRSHGTNTPREIWQFGKKGDWAYDIIEEYILLRYRLLPYNYSLSWNVTSEAGSIMRALAMDFPGDQKVYDINNEYMYGRSFLVAPVTSSFYTSGTGVNSVVDFKHTQVQKVYLPQNSGWFDFWTGEKMKGGGTISREVPLNIIPLYVKEGSIIPVGPDVQYAGEDDWKMLEIRIYDGADAEFILYEDEKDNYNYEKGMYSVIPMKWNNSNRTLTIEDRKGEFSGMLKNRKFNIVLVANGHGIGMDFSSAGKVIAYQGKCVTLKFD